MHSSRSPSTLSCLSRHHRIVQCHLQTSLIQVRPLSTHPSGVRTGHHKAVTTVIFALLDVTFSIEDWYQYTLSPSICSVCMMLLNSYLHSIFIPKLPIHFNASAGISSAPTAFPHFIPLSALYVSFSYGTCHCLVRVSFFCLNSLVFLIHQHVKVLAPSLLAYYFP